MINYKIVDLKEKRKKMFGVFEKGTQNVVKTFYNKDEAMSLCRHLNLGGGFDGNTPAFFLKNNSKSYTLNEVYV